MDEAPYKIEFYEAADGAPVIAAPPPAVWINKPAITQEQRVIAQ